MAGKEMEMGSLMNQQELVLRAGTNQIELLEFWLEKEREDGEIYRGIYGINVSKVLEVIRMTELTEVPNVPPVVMGMIQLRGISVPVVSLAQWLNIKEPKVHNDNRKIIIAEFNDTRIGFVVHQTSRIRRTPWEQIKVPPALIKEEYEGCITGTTLIEDEQTLLILDLEKVVAELTPDHECSFEIPKSVQIEENARKRILVVDDSLVARKQVMRVLKKGNYQVELCVNGQEAWQCIMNYYRLAQNEGVPIRQKLYLVITDVEMPAMDGYTLARKIKEDERLRGLPVILHSSLSGEANIKKGREVGCDEYITKFDPGLLFSTVSRF